MATIRDLVPFPLAGVSTREALENPTPVDLATTEIERQVTARLPGDSVEDHPWYRKNPFGGKNPQEVARLLAANQIPADQRRDAQEWIRTYETLTGERVSGGPRRV